METYSIRNLSFIYPDRTYPTLSQINLDIKSGEFITICGKSGCGKSTLLRHLKTVLSPHGIITGEIFFEGRLLSETGKREQSSQIGYVLQSPENQTVTDKVWHELAFGLESLGMETALIRRRVAEMASFFGIQEWFHKNVSELSGGQKQLLSLASIMAMQPKVIVLDEPTSQLDPIAASDFIETIARINRELGITVIMTEHRLEEVLPLSDRVIVMDDGKIISDADPSETGKTLGELKHSMFRAMPSPVRIYAGVQMGEKCPITVREGRQWISEISGKIKLKNISNTDKAEASGEPGINIFKKEDVAVELREIWFRYEKSLPDTVKGLSLKVRKGEFYAILGGNGTGKSTTLSLLSGIRKPYRGKIIIGGTELKEISSSERFGGLLGVVPQNPQTLFVKKTVYEDLRSALKEVKEGRADIDDRINEVSRLCELENLMESHPYDLSGGEQQRAALAKILLMEPDILLLDEPTKGLDAHFKHKLALILEKLQKVQITIIMVSHDIEFCASYADRCGMFFDGCIVSEDTPAKFFSGNSFYTTASNRMARHIIPDAVTEEDVITALGGILPDNEKNIEEFEYKKKQRPPFDAESKKSAGKIQVDVEKRCLSKRTVSAAIMIFIAIPFTIWFGIYYLDDRKYYLISSIVIFETLIPFMLLFESRKPQARELVIISVLCAIAVAGRTAFFMIPQFKPVVAMVIIAGVCFGGEAGFLVGAVTGFVSNFFFGQGPYTPWQMFAFGIIGFLAGILFRKGLLLRDKKSLCIFGGLSTFVIYGGLMNPASVIIFQEKVNMEMIFASYFTGIPFDLVHAASTVIFLYLIAEPMLEKLDRIKQKYGLIEN